MERRVLNLSNGDGTQRIIRLLNDLMERAGITHPDRSVTFAFPVTRHNLATWSGTSRATVVRALGGLRRKGIIDTGRPLTIIMPEELARKAVARPPILPLPQSFDEEPSNDPPNGVLQFEVLGQFRAHINGKEIDLGPPKAKLILAMLILAQGRPVTPGRLMEQLWEDVPTSAQSMLHAYISDLRRSLKSSSPNETGVYISYSDQAYVLSIDGEQVDLVKVRRLVAASRSLIAAQDYVRATPLIENALRIWREETFLAGLTG
ncbi:helix-turn-helix domain-containing protein, partial [Nonomuraea fuscirosea]